MVKLLGVTLNHLECMSPCVTYRVILSQSIVDLGENLRKQRRNTVVGIKTTKKVLFLVSVYQRLLEISLSNGDLCHIKGSMVLFFHL